MQALTRSDPTARLSEPRRMPARRASRKRAHADGPSGPRACIEEPADCTDLSGVLGVLVPGRRVGDAHGAPAGAAVPPALPGHHRQRPRARHLFQARRNHPLRACIPRRQGLPGGALPRAASRIVGRHSGAAAPARLRPGAAAGWVARARMPAPAGLQRRLALAGQWPHPPHSPHGAPLVCGPIAGAHCLLPRHTLVGPCTRQPRPRQRGRWRRR
jgi:hypothetical protein